MADEETTGQREQEKLELPKSFYTIYEKLLWEGGSIYLEIQPSNVRKLLSGILRENLCEKRKIENNLIKMFSEAS